MKTKILSFLLATVMTVMCFLPVLAIAKESTTKSVVKATSTTVVVSEQSTVTVTDEFGNAVTDAQGNPVTEAVTELDAKKQKSLEEQQKELEENLAQTDKKLAELEKSSKVTEEYIDTLDQKIGYVNEQLTVLENQNTKVQAEIDELMEIINKNEESLAVLSQEVERAQKEYDTLSAKFQSVYEAYCYRLKVIYISGEFNILAALMSCKDLSGFFTRYEMIRSVSKSDSELLAQVQSQMSEITDKKNGLNEKKAELETVKTELDSQKSDLLSKQKSIEKNSEEIANKKVSLATDRAESDRLLAELTAQNKQYTEFRNEDSELIEAVEQEIQDLIAGVITSEEATTAVNSDKNNDKKIEESDNSDIYSKSDAVLNMTYPVPSHHSISAGYPNYSSGKYHGGIDFPCATGSKVVAAQKGIVITVKRLDYSYGYYVMIYHGTDKSGRSVVTLYAHNSSILVSVGDSVEKGETIAKSGSTGNSTGPHCHFEVRLNGGRVNPKNYLS
ncbi:MAG: murein hydrolase activator EnvC family protein [Eubacterium sp.]